MNKGKVTYRQMINCTPDHKQIKSKSVCLVICIHRSPTKQGVYEAYVAPKSSFCFQLLRLLCKMARSVAHPWSGYLESLRFIQPVIMDGRLPYHFKQFKCRSIDQPDFSVTTCINLFVLAPLSIRAKTIPDLQMYYFFLLVQLHLVSFRSGAAHEFVGIATCFSVANASSALHKLVTVFHWV